MAGGLRQESDWSRQYHLWCSLVVVMLTFCLLRRLQHADIHTLHTVGLPVVADQSLSKSRPGVSLGGISGGDTSGSGLRSCMHSMGHPLCSPPLAQSVTPLRHTHGQEYPFLRCLPFASRVGCSATFSKGKVSAMCAVNLSKRAVVSALAFTSWQKAFAFTARSPRPGPCRSRQTVSGARPPRP